MLGMLMLPLLAAQGATPPPAWMVAAEAAFAAAYNAQDFAKVQSMYNPGAEILPPSADGFVLGKDAGSFFEQQYKAGLRDLSLKPAVVMQESPALWHELGAMGSNMGGGKYYIRWIKPDGGNWQIAFDCMAVGEKESSANNAPGAGGPPPAWLIKKDAEFAALYNDKNFTGVAGVYNPGAQLVPPAANVFLKQDQLASFFASAFNSGLHNLSLIPTVAYSESPTLLHEIGTSTASTGSGHYYVRWINTGTEWQIAFDIMAVGE